MIFLLGPKKLRLESPEVEEALRVAQKLTTESEMRSQIEAGLKKHGIDLDTVQRPIEKSKIIEVLFLFQLGLEALKYYFQFMLPAHPEASALEKQEALDFLRCVAEAETRSDTDNLGDDELTAFLDPEEKQVLHAVSAAFAWFEEHASRYDGSPFSDRIVPVVLMFESHVKDQPALSGLGYIKELKARPFTPGAIEPATVCAQYRSSTCFGKPASLTVEALQLERQSSPDKNSRWLTWFSDLPSRTSKAFENCSIQ